VYLKCDFASFRKSVMVAPWLFICHCEEGFSLMKQSINHLGDCFVGKASSSQ
jgi:hypothetical protein